MRRLDILFFNIL